MGPIKSDDNTYILSYRLTLIYPKVKYNIITTQFSSVFINANDIIHPLSPPKHN